jgi:long-subunit fatty acid transport protein
MKLLRILFFVTVLLASISFYTFSQGVAQPLTLQGLDNNLLIGARARAMGGGITASGNDVTSIFGNPAALSNLSSFEFRLGSSLIQKRYEQWQTWIPDEYYVELSLIIENNNPPNVKPFDALKPHWRKYKLNFHPSFAAIGYPFDIMGIEVTGGLGYAELLNLDHYYQNNNALSPNIGQIRPAPIPKPSRGDTLKVNWFQFTNQREGSLWGVTPTISVKITDEFSFGSSVTFLEGSSYDQEYRNDRGLFRLTTTPTGSAYNNFRLDSVYYNQSKYGQSKYKGVFGTIGFLYNQERYSIGLTLQPSWTMKSERRRDIVIINSSGHTLNVDNSSEKLALPFQYTIGIAIHPTDKWTIAIDYDTRNYGDVVYKPTQDTSFKPWLNSHRFRGGLEYNALKWLTLRGGYREEVQTVAAEGAALLQNPTRGSIYSFGFGMNFKFISFDFAYEYGLVKYEDMWLSNVNYNTKEKHEISFETCFKF